MKNSIKWSFIDPKTATKAVDLLGAKYLGSIKFYKDGKLFNKINTQTAPFYFNSGVNKEIRKFFKINASSNNFIEINKN
jgi:hypothetical protein